ncbi:restriction endonuclease subunit S [Arthrobacter sp. N199823]|uniref:restriction endonuclease subunit S n=1 Tax=Arthrobacter sp. N199823 TaxID=2058895 RepID=UPI000CE55D32|nr:restriction endonuclease subunit S [Arthrobacter sp. N199823]
MTVVEQTSRITPVETKAFLDVFADKTGGNPKVQTSNYLKTGKFPIVDQGRLEIAGYSNDPSLVAAPHGPVIIFGDHTRVLKYVEGPFILGADGTKVLVPKIDANVRFLFHYLRFVDIPSAGYSRHFKFLKSVRIPLPPPPEQRRIAAILDKAAHLRTQRREALAHLDALAQSIFHSMFADGSFPITTVSDVGRVQLGRQRAPKYQSGKYTTPYMRVANVRLNSLALDDVLSMDFDEHDTRQYLLNHGDILLNEGQSTELVGRPAMWRNEIDGCCFQNTLVRFVADRSRLAPEFALAVFLKHFRDGEFAKISSKTSSVAHLGASRFARMPFPVPPLELQQTFARRVASIERLKEQHRTQLAELDTLFASLQHRAFRGQL